LDAVFEDLAIEKNEERDFTNGGLTIWHLGQTHERMKLFSKVYLCRHDRDDELLFRNTRFQGGP
jgi:hypothetical protein